MSNDLDDKVKGLSDKIKEFDGFNFPKKHEYITHLKKWVVSIVERNYKIKKNPKLESVERIRQNVYCLDFGVNIGTEFSFFHFCVVIKEFEKTAIVVPMSTEKDDDPDWKSAGNLFVPIGVIEDMPYDKKPCYAMVNQIKTVSKQRLTDYYDNRQEKHVKMTLRASQMKQIFGAIASICNQPIKEKENLDTVKVV